MDIIYSIDFAVLDAIRKISCTALDYFFLFFTSLGEYGAFWIAVGAAMLIFKSKRKCGAAVLTSLTLMLIINDMCLKRIFERPRPVDLVEIESFIPRPSGYSFPSGHSCCAFAAATAIFIYDKRLGAAAYVIASLIAFSRLYFYVHFPTDIICGGILGAAIGAFSAYAVSRVSRRRAPKELSDL